MIVENARPAARQLKRQMLQDPQSRVAVESTPLPPEKFADRLVRENQRSGHPVAGAEVPEDFSLTADDVGRASKLMIPSVAV